MQDFNGFNAISLFFFNWIANKTQHIISLYCFTSSHSNQSSPPATQSQLWSCVSLNQSALGGSRRDLLQGPPNLQLQLLQVLCRLLLQQHLQVAKEVLDNIQVRACGRNKQDINLLLLHETQGELALVHFCIVLNNGQPFFLDSLKKRLLNHVTIFPAVNGLSRQEEVNEGVAVASHTTQSHYGLGLPQVSSPAFHQSQLLSQTWPHQST